MSETAGRAGTVIVAEEVNPIHVYDGTGQKVQAGQIVSRIYQGEKVQRHIFQSNGNVGTRPNQVGREKEYSLGPTTTQFKFVDHAAALEPLLDRGWTIKQQRLSRGGLQLWAMLEPEHPIEYVDPIDWDHPLWGGGPGFHGEDRPRVITQSMIVTTAVRPGKAITYQNGLFRLVCTNGLVHELMGLGKVRMNHVNFDAGKLAEALFGSPVKVLDESTLKGPYIGTGRGAARLARVLRMLNPLGDQGGGDQDGDEDDGDEAGEQPTLAARLAEELPLFVRKAVNPFVRLPSWYIDGLAGQFEQLVQAGQSRVHTLDVMNAVTSPITLEERRNGPSARSTMRPLLRSNTVTEAATQLIGAFSM